MATLMDLLNQNKLDRKSLEKEYPLLVRGTIISALYPILRCHVVKEHFEKNPEKPCPIPIFSADHVHVFLNRLYGIGSDDPIIVLLSSVLKLDLVKIDGCSEKTNTFIAECKTKPDKIIPHGYTDCSVDIRTMESFKVRLSNDFEEKEYNIFAKLLACDKSMRELMMKHASWQYQMALDLLFESYVDKGIVPTIDTENHALIYTRPAVCDEKEVNEFVKLVRGDPSIIFGQCKPVNYSTTKLSTFVFGLPTRVSKDEADAVIKLLTTDPDVKADILEKCGEHKNHVHYFYDYLKDVTPTITLSGVGYYILSYDCSKVQYKG